MSATNTLPEAPATDAGAWPWSAARLPVAPGRLLLLDDDALCRKRLARTFAGMGFSVVEATRVAEARAHLASGDRFEAAILEVRVGDGNGLDLIGPLRLNCPGIPIVILTAYSSLATAVLAIKAGATDYLPKPSDAGAVARALLEPEPEAPVSPDLPMPPDRLRWEHIQRVFEQCGRNVSATARQLGMHRRSLQRILTKRAPREQPAPRQAAPRLPTAAVAEGRLSA